MPQVITGFEPSGDNWALVAEKVYYQEEPGTQVQAGYVVGGGPYIFGWDLWGSISIDDLHASCSAKGMWIDYISVWRDQPAIIGWDSYLACMVYRAGTGG